MRTNIDMKNAKKVFTYLFIVGVALVYALSYTLFVFPNKFAPAGLSGICTMVQYVFGINVGYLTLIINIPLAMWIYFSVSKPLAVRSMVFVVVYSLALVVLEHFDLSAFAYYGESSRILGPLVAGIVNGACYAQLLKASAYTGGTDFVAALIHKNHPEKSIFGLIFAMNALVAVASYFVYDYKIEPVILCILYSFASSTLSERVTKSGRTAVRCEIITDRPQEISDAIIGKLRHSATLIPAKGMYSGKETNVLICVVNKTQVAALSAIIRSFPNTFAVFSQANEVMGNFLKIDEDGEEEVEFLDPGDGKAV
jgi:uncharacterized membrane-anchored protein YitT (DUF2179 family)